MNDEDISEIAWAVKDIRDVAIDTQNESENRDKRDRLDRMAGVTLALGVRDKEGWYTGIERDAVVIAQEVLREVDKVLETEEKV